MQRFRKKPVVIEAIQWTGDNFDEIDDWSDREAVRLVAGDLHIFTLEGAMRADPGDWIIRGVVGEYYPCKPEIFECTYEPAS